MKKVIFSLFFLLVVHFLPAQVSVKLKGAIDKYQIEMELWPSEEESGSVKGKYNYAGKTAFLNLEGDLFGSEVLHLEESWNGKKTGEFFLEWQGDGKWTGTWIGEKSKFEANLETVSGTRKNLGAYDLKEYSAKTSSSITGSYANEIYFVSDLFYSEENRTMEIVFNGGVVSVKEVSDKEIKVGFNLICGPTFHLAWFAGTAQKIGDRTYEAKVSEFDDEESCHLIFKFTDRSLHINQLSSGMACGFGARAYAEGDFVKVNDKVSDKEEPGIRDVLER